MRDFTSSKDLVSYFKLPSSLIKKLDVLNQYQLAGLAKDFELYPSFFNSLKSEPNLIVAYQKLFANRSLRVDEGYLRSILKQLDENPNLRPTVQIRKKAINRTKYEVPLLKKTFKLREVTIEGVFPDFKNYTVFTTKLRVEQYFLRDRQQFSIAKKELMRFSSKNEKALIKKLNEINGASVYFHPQYGNVSGKRLIDLQISEIKDPKKTNIIGLTWHHNEAYGVLDLVNYDVHKKIPHTGGRAIWGGGGGHR